MLRLVFLGSGSSGNACLVGWEKTRVLVDCGLGIRELRRRLEQVGECEADIGAVFVTHEHIDHVRGLSALARKPERSIHLTAKTAGAVSWGPRAACERLVLRAGREVACGPLRVLPFPTSHDAREPVGYRFTFPDGSRLGIATDLGQVSGAVVEALAGCEVLALESNHDLELLRDGPYPWYLKRRIASDRGHLSNPESAALLERVACGDLRALFALHLSETNNRPGLVRDVLAAQLQRLGLSCALQVAAPDRPVGLGLELPIY